MGVMINIWPEEYFRLSNGRVLKNLNELLNAIKSIDEETFKFHVNEEKNDFGNWVRDVFKDEELAKLIFNSKTREDILKVLEVKLNVKKLVKSPAKKVSQKDKPMRDTTKDITKITQGDMLLRDIPLEKIEEILMKEKEIEKREEKIEEIEARIEKNLGDLAAKKEPKFFSKEFVQGVVIGLLFALIIGLTYFKFFV